MRIKDKFVILYLIAFRFKKKGIKKIEPMNDLTNTF